MPILATITVVTILMGGGSNFTLDHVIDAAKEGIKDKDRSKQVVAITKRADKEFKSFNKNIGKLSKQLVQMNADYNLTREEIDSFYNQSDKSRMAFLERFIELRFEAKNLMTPEEWEAIYTKIQEEASK
jgi:phosphorylcholine metabolism protein LicD